MGKDLNYVHIYTKWLEEYSPDIDGVKMNRIGITDLLFTVEGDTYDFLWVGFTIRTMQWRYFYDGEDGVYFPEGLGQEELYDYVNSIIINSKEYKAYLTKKKLEKFLHN